jgi:hypothetical protein
LLICSIPVYIRFGFGNVDLHVVLSIVKVTSSKKQNTQNNLQNKNKYIDKIKIRVPSTIALNTPNT